MADLARAQWQPRPPALGEVNSVLLARSRHHVVKDFPGPLSIKTVVHGRVAWHIDRRQAWVDQSTFLVLNDREPYSMHIEAAQPVSTCCVFFQQGFVETIFRDRVSPDARILDDPAPSRQSITFVSCVQPKSVALSAGMADLRQLINRAATPLELDECYLRLASVLVSHFEVTWSQLRRISASRPSTRAELYRRVSRGREYLHANFGALISLSSVARAAGMSPFHFHRTFVQAFNKTPARYLSDLRFARAEQLLMNNCPVTQVCLDVGFGSLGSFSTAFRKSHGVPPSQFHKKFRKLEEALPPEVL